MMDMNTSYSDVHIVIRSVGERTEKICMSILQSVFKNGDICIIKNVTPFNTAIEKSFRSGIESNRRWTLVVDADVLLFKDRIVPFLNEADYLLSTVENVCYPIFCIQPYVIDPFFSDPRLAGIHLYKTEHLKIACKYCGQKNEKSLRPETYIKRCMRARGYLTYDISIIVGIHDYFQSYRSLVKKGILHINKHSNAESLFKDWVNKSENMEDYKWMLIGARIGRKIKQEDIQVDSYYMDRLLEMEGIEFPKQQDLSEDEVKELMDKLEYQSIHKCIYSTCNKNMINEIFNRVMHSCLRILGILK